MMCRGNWRIHLVSLLGGVALLVAQPGAAWSQDMLGANVNGLMAFDFATDYVTPRGLHVEDEGLVTQPLLLVFWKLRAAPKAAVTDITLTTGLWNSFHSVKSGANPSRWNEIDPILSLGIKFRNGLALDTGTTAFYTPTDSYATSAHVDFKLTYNDRPHGGIAINPYVAYWFELHNKATVMFNPATSSRGSYLTVGAAPTFGIGAGATVELGTFANFVSSDFYQQFDGSDGGSGMAVLSVAPKVSLPLKFLGVTHGAWTAYAGLSYYYLNNQGLLDGNQVLSGASGPESNVTKFRTGLSVFF